MAGLVPQNAQAIAQILVQYISSTGACVIDLPAAAPALNICNSIEIRSKQQDVIEQYFNSICIAPTQAIQVAPAPAPAPAPAEPKQSAVQALPWRTKSSPRILDGGGEDDCGDDDGGVVVPPMPNDPVQAEPPPTVPVQERPAVPDPLTTSFSPAPPSVTRPAAPPAGPSGKGGDSSTSVSTSSFHQSPSPSSSSSSSLLSSLLFPSSSSSSSSLSTSLSPSSSSSTSSSSSFSSPSSSRPPPATTPPSEPELPTLTMVLSSSLLPPSPSSPSSPTLMPTAPVRVPEDEEDDPPEPPPPASTTPPPPPPPPAPVEVIPDPCESAYTSINVSDISDVNQDSYNQYLHLVGMDLAQHHSKDKNKDKNKDKIEAEALAEAKKTLVHEFRVRCGVDMPDGPAPVFPGLDGGEKRARVREGHRGCLEMCEREAILKAGDGLLHECLGVAYRDRVDASDGEGDCRFWWGDKSENMFLPVHMLPSTSGDGDRWQVLYM